MTDVLYTAISTSYYDAMNSGKFCSNKSWAFTSSFVKWIFTELGYVRVIAHDRINVQDTWAISGKLLFATLNSHVIMDEFTRLSRNYPRRTFLEMVNFVYYIYHMSDDFLLGSHLTEVEFFNTAIKLLFLKCTHVWKRWIPLGIRLIRLWKS